MATYGQIATYLGSPRAARAVGHALKSAVDVRGLPWHRVINAAGRISEGGHLHRPPLQRILLAREGVQFFGRGQGRIWSAAAGHLGRRIEAGLPTNRGLFIVERRGRDRTHLQGFRLRLDILRPVKVAAGGQWGQRGASGLFWRGWAGQDRAQPLA